MTDTPPRPLFNREYSWLEFNRRVLAEAQNPAVPLLERVKFLAICSSNLDEFFMVRVAGVRDLVRARITERSPDGLTPQEQLAGIRERAGAFLVEMYRCWDGLAGELGGVGIRVAALAELPKRDQAALKERFDREIAPILTPLAFDPSHPFPFLTNLGLSMILVLVSESGEEHVVFLKLPSLVPRFLATSDPRVLVPLEAVVAEYAGSFFPGLRIKRTLPFRVIRNADISIREEEVQDLLKSVESELRRRDRKEIVWIEVAAGAGDPILTMLAERTGTAPEDVFAAAGPLKLSDLLQLHAEFRDPDLHDPPYNPRIPAALATSEDIFSIVRRGDVLLHRPYDTFGAVVEFVQAAAEDPDVVAIKQTLYRTGRESPIVEALAAAAARGKQVTAVIELQARFDEVKNIIGSRMLEEAGVQVVYGLFGVKTHCKLCLVVRREAGVLRRYLHLSTGNYNAQTARLYTDIDLFTCDEEFGADAAQLFNLLTGFSAASAQDLFERRGPAPVWRRFVISPLDYHNWLLEKIAREERNARQGIPAAIAARLNALVDPKIAAALYQASEAGVEIDLQVRGICCLVPGVPGVSGRIRVTSVVDRFLEHSRLFVFANGGEADVWLSSADWMPRNFFRRIEITFPVLAPALRARLQKEILATGFADTVKSWTLQPDGTSVRTAPAAGARPVRSQERFIEIARAEAVRLGPYDQLVARPGAARRQARRPKRRDAKKT